MIHPPIRRLAAAAFVLLAFVALTALPGVAQANNQTVVLGLGLGVYEFSGSDDVRDDDPVLGDSLDSGALVHFYVEWYALDTVGFGYRAIGVATGRDARDPSTGDEVDQTVSLGAGIFTFHWVPWGSEEDTRFGVMLGIGGGDYENEVTFTDGATGNDTTATDSTDGTVGLFGAYIDFGGDLFGGRVGIESLDTNLDDFDDGSSADASGLGYYVDVRWAFQ